MTTINATKDQGKIAAWKRRQEDTGWGRVLLQCYVPCYWIHYAWSRRTITPWLCGVGISFLASFLAAFCIGLTFSDKSEEEIDALATIAGLMVSPFGTKAGTDRARKFAAKKLAQ